MNLDARRNHLPVPEVDAKTWSLHVGGEGLRNLTLDLDSLKNKFKKYSVTATVQCAGKAVLRCQGLTLFCHEQFQEQAGE
jgi:DMSO/TMAO reductase YedYZ molybdopterin-dependent catalytic subunit